MEINYKEGGYYRCTKNILCVSNMDKLSIDDEIIIYWIEEIDDNDFCMCFSLVGTSDLRYFYFNGESFFDNFKYII